MRSRPAKPSSEPCSRDVLVQRRDVEAVRRVRRRPRRPRRDHRRALLVQLGRGDPADVAEALDDAAQLGEVPAEPRARALDHHHDAGARRLVPEDRAADRDRLAGHDLRHGVALLHRVGVHHPGHRLLVRRHVRRRDVELRADERRELGGEAAREPRELGLRELARVAAHAALRAAVRQAQERALPGHPHRERGALAEVDRRRRSGRRPSSARAPTSAARGRRGTTRTLPSSIRTGSVRITARSG